MPTATKARTGSTAPSPIATEQAQEGRQDGGLEAPRPGARVGADGRLRCGVCRQELPPDAFRRQPGKTGRRSVCRRCERADRRLGGEERGLVDRALGDLRHEPATLIGRRESGAGWLHIYRLAGGGEHTVWVPRY